MSMTTRLWASVALVVGLGLSATSPPARAQDTLTRVLVSIADVAMRGGYPYDRYSGDRLVVQRDQYGRPVYYRNSGNAGHHDVNHNGYGNGYGNSYGNGYGNSDGYGYGNANANGYYGNANGHDGNASYGNANGYYGNNSHGNGHNDNASRGHNRNTARRNNKHRKHERHDCQEHGQCDH